MKTQCMAISMTDSISDELNRYFHCVGSAHKKNHSFHPEGFLLKPLQGCIEKIEKVSLFGREYILQEISDNDVDQMFVHGREAFMMLFSANTRRRPKHKGSFVDIASYSRLRNEISRFLGFLYSFLNISATSRDADDLLLNLEKNLRLFHSLHQRMALARLPLFASVTNVSENDKNTSSFFHVNHCHLDVRWLFLNIIRSLEESRQSQDYISQFMYAPTTLSFEEEVILLLEELTWLSYLRFKKSDKTEALLLTAFPCICVKELWILLMHADYKSQDFWTFFNETLRQVLDKKGFSKQASTVRLEADYNCSRTISEFILWLMAEISRLQLYNKYGEIVENEIEGVAHFDIVNDALKSLIASGNVDEATLRFILPLLYKIHEVWGHAKCGPVLMLWDYFYKQIDSACYIPGSKLNTLLIISKTAPELIDQVRKRLDGSTKDKYENSFLMYLRLVGDYLKTSRANGSSTQRLCSRIFVRLCPEYQHRLQELSEIGVFHVTSLYLTLALGTNNPAPLHKLVQLLEAVPRVDISEGKREMIWRAYAAALLTFDSMGFDFSESLEIILKHVNWTIKSQALTPLSHFLDAIRIIAQNNLETVKGMPNWIKPWIGEYLKECSPNEGRKLLMIFVPILENLYKVRNSDHPNVRAIMENLKLHFVPLLNVQNNDAGSKVAALLSLISSQWRSQLFPIWSNTKDCVLSGKYLTILFETDAKNVQSNFPQTIPLAKQVWIRWTCQCGPNADTNNLFNILCQLPCFPSLSIDAINGDPLYAIIDYFGNKYEATESWQEKNDVRAEFLIYFNDFDKWLQVRFKNLNTVSYDEASNIYRYCGQLFLKCGYLIYIRSNPKCLFPALMDSLILPLAMFNSKYSFPQNITRALNENFELFIDGLLLMADESDAYMMRMARDTISNYLHRFSNFSKHPYITLLLTSSHSAKMLKILVKLLKIQDGSVNQHASEVLLFFHRILTENDIGIGPELSQRVFDHTCEALIDLVIQLNDVHPLKEIIKRFLTLALTNFHNRQKFMETLSDSCKKHLATNAFKWFRAVYWMNCLAWKDLQLITPMVTTEIEEIEKSKGVEKDVTLRSLLNKMTNEFGCNQL